MVTNHYRAPYDAYFHHTLYDSTAPVRRQEKSFDYNVTFSDIVRCPVKLRVIEGKVASACHRTIFCFWPSINV